MTCPNACAVRGPQDAAVIWAVNQVICKNNLNLNQKLQPEYSTNNFKVQLQTPLK